MNHEHGTRYVRVIVDRAIHRELDYSVPETLAARIGVGCRVRVPFRDKSALATVVAIPEQSEISETTQIARLQLVLYPRARECLFRQLRPPRKNKLTLVK